MQNKLPEPTKLVSLRKEFGNSLVRLAELDPKIVALDAEVSNSTFSYLLKQEHPERFFEMFIAEQNMISVALGMSLRGYKPFISTFGAFLTRAFDQIRMCQYSKANLKIIGTHCGVSIGEDGPSQMALEDISMFRSIQKSIILYPSDANSLSKQMNIISNYIGISYLRVTRAELPIIYDESEEFNIGGSKTLFETENDKITLISAGITLHECLKAKEILKNNYNIQTRVIDLYSIKPLDVEVIKKALAETEQIIVVEDHYQSGGIYETIQAIIPSHKIKSLCVKIAPRSGKPEELLEYAEIDYKAILKAVAL